MILFYNGITRLTFKLLHYLNNVNQAISPYSFSTIISPIENIISDNTKLQLLFFLNYNKISTFNSDLCDHYTNWSECHYVNNVTLLVNNFLIYDSDLILKDSILKSNNHIQIRSYNMANKNKIINEVSTTNLYSTVCEDFIGDSFFNLINTFNFDGVWEDSFIENYDDNISNITTRYSNFNSFDCEGYFAVEIKYRNPMYSFIAFMPKNPSMWRDMIAELCTVDGLTSLKHKMKETKIQISLPKFKYECEITFDNLLKKGDFTNLFKDCTLKDKELECRQKIIVELNELGTKISAQTIVQVGNDKELVINKETKKIDKFLWFIIKYDRRKKNLMPIFVGNTGR